MILADPKVDPEADKLQVSTLIDRPTGPPSPNERSRNDLWSGSRSGRGRRRTYSVNVSVWSEWMAQTSHTVNIWYEEHVYAREKRSSDPPRTQRLYRGAPRSCSEPL